MALSLLVLFFGALLGGLATNWVRTGEQFLRLPLVFAGSFLFAITLIHILPELFTLADNPMRVGVFVLAGFFLQVILEQFTSGVEHGHMHAHASTSKYTILIALVTHSLMEGALLTHDSPFHEQHYSFSLLLGIVLHKAPAAFALIAIFRGNEPFSIKHVVVLLIFSISSPIGLLFMSGLGNVPKDSLMILFAIVSGAFLHISTTIFVESSPNHKLQFGKLAVAVLGALLALLSEYFL